MYLQSRASEALAPQQQVITASFALDEADRTALADIDSDDKPRYFDYMKCVDGSYRSGLQPRVTRRRGALDAATRKLFREMQSHAFQVQLAACGCRQVGLLGAARPGSARISSGVLDGRTPTVLLAVKS